MWNFSRPKHTDRYSLDDCIVSLHICQGLAGKGDGLATLDEGSTLAILTRISLHYDWMGPVIVYKCGVEECATDPGLEVLEGCIHSGVPVPFGKLLSQGCGFVC